VALKTAFFLRASARRDWKSGVEGGVGKISTSSSWKPPASSREVEGAADEQVAE